MALWHEHDLILHVDMDDKTIDCVDILLSTCPTANSVEPIQ